MKIMANDSSAIVRSETPHLSADIKQRAQTLINNKSLDSGTRAVLRYGLDLICRAWRQPRREVGGLTCLLLEQFRVTRM
jgi:hypothetical protein